jgi:hypothetical protein
VEHAEQRLELTGARRSEEGVHHLALPMEVRIRHGRAPHPPAGPGGQLSGRVRRSPHDRCDVRERHAEHVVQHERQPLRRGESVEHDEQRQPDRVGLDCLVFRVSAHHRVRHPAVQRCFTARRTGAQHVQTDPADDRGEPPGQVLHLGIRPGQAQPRLLYGVLGFGERAEHPIRHGLRVRTLRGELRGQSFVVHGHVPPRGSVITLTRHIVMT